MRPSRRQTQPFLRRWPAGRPSVTDVLVAMSIGAFVSQLLLNFALVDHEAGGLVQEWVALDAQAIQAGRFWTFLTYPLLHVNALHLLANMLLLYFAGKEVEPILGTRHFIVLYLTATVLGGIAHLLAMPLAPLMGATPAIAALIIASTTILPEQEIRANLLFIMPVKLRAKYLGLASLIIAAIALSAPIFEPIGPAGVIAASALAWLYVKQLGFGNPLALQRYIFDRRQRAARLDRMNADQFISYEIDPILDKISREGMQSLNRAERKILSLGSDKIAARTARKS